jgi:hypothetical protein
VCVRVDVPVVIVLMIAVRVMMMAAFVIVCRVDRMALTANGELRGRDAGAIDALGRDHIRRNRQAAERTPYLVDGHAGVDERTHDHVAGRSRKAVEVESCQT